MKNLSKLILFSIFFAALVHAEIPEHILNKARGMGEAGTLRARARGAAVFSAKNLRAVGGVMFQGVLDSPTLYDLQSIDFNEKQGIGILTLGLNNSKSVSYEAPYWIIKPAIEYAISDDNGVVSLFGQPSEEELYNISPSAVKGNQMINQYETVINTHDNCIDEINTGQSSQECYDFINNFDLEELKKFELAIDTINNKTQSELNEFYNYFFFAEVHDALKSTGLGFRMLQADSMLIDSSYIEVVPVKGNQASFPLERGTTKEETGKLDLMLSYITAFCQKATEQQIQAWILTDVNTVYSFSFVDEKLKINGSPYYYLWGPTENEETAGIPACNDALALLHPQFESKAPRTWTAAVTVAQTSALIRGIIKANPQIKATLAEILNKSNTVASFPTPRLWPRGGYQDI